jgi:hypothetical protein
MRMFASPKPYVPSGVVDQTLVANAVTVAVPTQQRGSVKLVNNSAAAATITLATSGATDGQSQLIRFYDFSAAAQTLTFVNTENSTVSVPAQSNGSTTLPVTIGFVFNGDTSLWRCVGVA